MSLLYGSYWRIKRSLDDEEIPADRRPVTGRFVEIVCPADDHNPEFRGIALTWDVFTRGPEEIVRLTDEELLRLPREQQHGLTVTRVFARTRDGLLLESDCWGASWLPSDWKLPYFPAAWSLSHLER